MHQGFPFALFCPEGGIVIFMGTKGVHLLYFVHKKVLLRGVSNQFRPILVRISDILQVSDPVPKIRLK